MSRWYEERLIGCCCSRRGEVVRCEAEGGERKGLRSRLKSMPRGYRGARGILKGNK